jgi:hypothetical protein
MRAVLLAVFVALAGAAETIAASWTSLGPSNRAGRALALAFDPVDANVLWVGSAGAVSGGAATAESPGRPAGISSRRWPSAASPFIRRTRP